MAQTKRKQTKNVSKLKKLVSAFNPTNFKGGMALFALVFSLAGGGYYTYHSFASTCLNTQISQGSTGTCVSHLQYMLNGIDYSYNGYCNNGSCLSYKPLVTDAKFGSLTKADVQAYQKWNYLPNDGVVGPQTWQALCSYAAQKTFSGASEPQVRRLAFAAAIYAGCKTY